MSKNLPGRTSDDRWSALVRPETRCYHPHMEAPPPKNAPSPAHPEVSKDHPEALEGTPVTPVSEDLEVSSYLQIAEDAEPFPNT